MSLLRRHRHRASARNQRKGSSTRPAALYCCLTGRGHSSLACGFGWWNGGRRHAWTFASIACSFDGNHETATRKPRAWLVVDCVCMLCCVSIMYVFIRCPPFCVPFGGPRAKLVQNCCEHCCFAVYEKERQPESHREGVTSNIPVRVRNPAVAISFRTGWDNDALSQGP